MGCVEGSTYIYTAEGTGAGARGGDVPADAWDWQQAAVLEGRCHYDNGLLIDDDDTMYVTWGNRNLSVARLTADGLAEAEARVVFRSGDTYLEGAHLYKTRGYYWIVPTKVASGEWVLRSREPFGPYEARVLFDGLAGPLANAGYAHQGGMVDTAAGDWYYIAFLDAYPGGRIPVMAPLRWTDDDWPELVTDADGAWGREYPRPAIATPPDAAVPPPTGVDGFAGPRLGEEWEWNHNPDTGKFAFAEGGDGGLVLATATVTDDLFSARNTLTRRVLGPVSQATWVLDVGGMAAGDRCGAALFRDTTAYVGVHADGADGARRLVYVDGLRLDGEDGWRTAANGTVAAAGPTLAPGADVVHLRVVADVTPAFGLAPVRQARFSYSLDGGATYEPLGEFTLQNSWNYFTGYRFAAFNYATQALGGNVTLKSFEMVLV